MSQLEQLRRHARPTAEPAPPAQQAVKRQLAWAVGAEGFQDRDPVYHLNESFCQTFDLAGSLRARGQAGAVPDAGLLETFLASLTSMPGLGEAETAGTPEQSTGLSEADMTPEFLQKTSFDDVFQPTDGQERLMNRFSDIAFGRGKLASAVIQGTGDMMLVTCMKRTLQQSQPKTPQQRKLFQGASKEQKVRTPGGVRKAAYNRGFVDSAVGLTVNVLADVNAVLEDMQGMVRGDRGLFPGSAETLQKVYPFLTDDKEQGLLAQYRAQLRQLGDTPENGTQRAILEKACSRTQAVMDRKATLRRRFLDQLRMLKDSAATAIAVFNTSEFRMAANQELRESQPEPPPPRDGDDGGRDGQGSSDPAEDAES